MSRSLARAAVDAAQVMINGAVGFFSGPRGSRSARPASSSAAMPADEGDAVISRGRDETSMNEAREPSDVCSPDLELLDALHSGRSLGTAVPGVLDRISSDPLASAGHFPGDFLRGLMEVRSDFWSRNPRLYSRYREALRAGAATRRRLPPDERLDFWVYAPVAFSTERRLSSPRGQPDVVSGTPDPIDR